MAQPDRKLCPLTSDGAKLIFPSNNLSMESNFPYVGGIGPLDAGTTKAAPDKGASTKLKARLRAV